MAQTNVQHSETIRFGSGMLEIGADVASLVNVGAFRGGKFTESFEKVTIKSDNAGTIFDGIKDHEALLEAELMEINLDNLAKFYSGIHTLEVVAGAPTNVVAEPIVLSLTGSKRLAHRNAAGTEVATPVVKHTSGAPTYVRNTDYVLGVDADGFTTIARIAAGAITSGATVKVDYTYTPAAHRQYDAGGLQTLNAQVARFTNYNAAGEKFEITVWKATSEEGIAIEFQPDDADDVNVTPIKVKGTNDTARVIGKQLFTIIDEQHAE